MEIDGTFNILTGGKAFTYKDFFSRLQKKHVSNKVKFETVKKDFMTKEYNGKEYSLPDCNHYSITFDGKRIELEYLDYWKRKDINF